MSIAELRKNRMAQGLSLTEISRRTRIGVTHLRHIEEGNFKSLPPGFYARAFVRAYAEAIGMDADIVLGELSDSLPASAHAAMLDFPNQGVKETFVSQCNYCHQQGNALTRRPRRNRKGRHARRPASSSSRVRPRRDPDA